MNKLILISILLLSGCDLEANSPMDNLAIKKCRDAGGERLSKGPAFPWQGPYKYRCFDVNGEILLEFLFSQDYDQSSNVIEE